MNPQVIQSLLINFVEKLRLLGFNVGVEQHLHVQQVVDYLIETKQWSGNIEDLHSWVAPLLCTNPKDQIEFDAYFEEWVADIKASRVLADDATASENDILSEETPPSRPNAVPYLIFIGFVALLILAGGAGLIASKLRHLDRTVQGRVLEDTSPPSIVSNATLELTYKIDGVDSTQHVVSDDFGEFSFTVPGEILLANLKVQHDAPSDFLTQEMWISLSGDTTLNLQLSRFSHQFPALEQYADSLAEQVVVLTRSQSERFDGLESIVSPRLTTLQQTMDSLQAAPARSEASLTNLESELDNISNIILSWDGNQESVEIADVVQEINDLAGPVIPPLPPLSFFDLYSREILMSLAFLAFILWLTWYNYKKPMILKRRSVSSDPERLEPVRVKGNNQSLFRGVVMRRALRELRRHKPVENHIIEPEASVESTIMQGGYFTPVYKKQFVSPEYLVLIDCTGLRDQRAMFIEQFIRRLDREGVYVDRFFFMDDPRLCWADTYRHNLSVDTSDINFDTSLSIYELIFHYPDHRLIVFSDGDGLINPLNGYPYSWLTVFSQWQDRVLMTFEPPDMLRTDALAEYGFRMLPASTAGLSDFAELIHSNARNKYNRFQETKPLPRLLATRPERWLSRSAPKAEMAQRLCNEIKDFLGPEGYFWFVACAMYPELHWNITLFLGQHLTYHPQQNGQTHNQSRPLFTEQRLTALMRLPWFQASRIPDWFRKHLLESLPPEQEEEIRNALTELLHPEQKVQREGFKLKIASDTSTQRPHLLKRIFSNTEDMESPLRDYVFLAAMTGRKVGKLALKAPNFLKRLLFKEGQPILGLRPASIFALALLFMAITWFSAGSVELPDTKPSAIPRFSIVSDTLNGSPHPDIGLPFAQSDSTLGYYLTNYYTQVLEMPQEQVDLLFGVPDTSVILDYLTWLSDSLQRHGLLTSDQLEFKTPESEVTPIDILSPANLANIEQTTSPDQKPLLLGRFDQDPLSSEDLVPPAVAISYSPDNPTENDVVTFSARTLSGTIDNFSWVLPGGVVDTSATPIFRFSTAGTYPISLTAQNAIGLQGTATTAVTVRRVFTSNDTFTITGPTRASVNDTLTFSVQNQFDAYSWDLGDASQQSGSPTITHTFSQPGVYVITAEVQRNGVPASASVVVTIQDNNSQNPGVAAQIATISANPEFPDTRTPVTFIPDVKGHLPLTYAWSFGTVGSSTAARPTFTFDTAGTYPITLQVANDSGSDSRTIELLVEEYQAERTVIQDITFEPKRVATGTQVRFRANVTGPPPESYSWSFGDGNTSTDASPFHTYNQDKEYNVELTITHERGVSTATTPTISVIKPRRGEVIVLDIDGPDSLRVNQSGTFMAVVNNDAREPIEYNWNFGNSRTGIGKTVTHSYSQPGAYRIATTATNDRGLDTGEIPIIVYRPPVPAEVVTISASPQNPDTRTPIAFASNTRGDIPIAYDWTFGDAGSSASLNPTFTFDQAGAYTVTLRASNNAGSDSRSMTITVDEYEADYCSDVVEMPSIVFDRNSSALTNDALRLLQDETLPIATDCPNTNFRVEGYATSDERNPQDLSEDRARIIEQFLTANGIAISRMMAIGQGATGSGNGRRVDMIPIR